MDYKKINESIINAISPLLKENNLLTKQDKFGTEFFLKNDKIYFNFGYSLTENCSEGFLYNVYSKNWLNIAFPEVEKIIHPILSKNELFGKSITYDEVYKSFSIDIKIKNQVGRDKFVINSDSDLSSVISLFKDFITQDALSFYQNWSNLNVLYEYLKTLPEEREILSNTLGIFYQLKKAIIYRLCNDDSALEYIESYYERRKMIYEKYPEEIPAERYYQASKELKDCLLITKPKYNL